MITFVNDGAIDIQAVTAFGVSAKTEGAIGFFGTGLKYAIAILLRTGHQITIWSGTKKLVFGTRKVKIRDKVFEFVTMNNRRCEFTTEVGKTWKVWQAFRELYCNCTDEKGTVYSDAEGGFPEFLRHPDQTIIQVEGEEFQKAYDERSKIILTTPPLASSLWAEIHPGPSEYVYYKGVQSYKLMVPSLYTYNLLVKLELTEDRTLKYIHEINYWIKTTIQESSNEEVVRDILLAPLDKWEHAIHFDGKVSETFTKVVVPLAQVYDSRLNLSATSCCRMSVAEILAANGEMPLDKLESNRIARAVAFCNRLGYKVDEYPVVITENLGEGVLGRAHNGKIYVSKRALMMGTKMVAGTLLEEFLHLKHDLVDETRGMQNFLIDSVISLGERLTGEPL